jgi:hypothetical protein
MSKILVDGTNECSNSDYHADRKYLSSSVLKVLYKSLDDYHEQYILGNKPQIGNEASLSEGSLTHAYILEPHNVKHDFVFYNGLRKQGPEFNAFKDALDPADRRTIISKPQKIRVESNLQAYKRRPEAVALIQNGFAEHTICGTLNGIPIKVRFDYMNLVDPNDPECGAIYDVKTTADPADIFSFRETIKRYGYQLSAALYLAMAEKHYGKKFNFYFIVISKQQPQTCEVYKLAASSRAEGQRMIDVACTKFLFATEKNIWSEREFQLTRSDAPATISVSSYEILEV